MSMLLGAPWLLGHKSMLQVNQPRKISLYGADYVMWKDVKGEINALPNVCPHMGAMLSEGWCEVTEDKSSVVVCPFHALEFDREGCTILPGSKKKTLPQLKPLELIIQGNFIWSYGGIEAKIPIPNILNKIASKYDFVGHIADISVETQLLPMLLNMHDYNHQNGTHRPLFKIKEILFEKFIDNGHESHAFYNMPKAPVSLAEKIKKPDLLLIPKVIKAHLENHFPHLVIFHGETAFGKIAQCHLFVPESENKTRTYILMFGESNSPISKFVGKTALEFAKVVVEQDADILGKIYPNSQHKIKLNNEVGMDWVRRNFESFPEVVEPNLSKE
ncbi:Rieske 2Fe-2S domain-containing protein [Plectonema cf. radiosum LEGE 06105]|uniref:Rieske 2Fe-2S domain-containing protein n=1 Tax=Plectonema cf. radiosum LEGE 06105 TaxID=945769 RepID=A0A8J7F2P6_9CYAN|nr:Rieske 2Fe-2S domain-containing protein [Plectonema radiosum]MBE9211269.1 Rieske 2Fe-2S domain-containing protein [Plectonema cf. radiosum LEGE 06105]